jgi:hypothetical protein
VITPTAFASGMRPPGFALPSATAGRTSAATRRYLARSIHLFWSRYTATSQPRPHPHGQAHRKSSRAPLGPFAFDARRSTRRYGMHRKAGVGEQGGDTRQGGCSAAPCSTHDLLNVRAPDTRVIARPSRGRTHSRLFGAVRRIR